LGFGVGEEFFLVSGQLTDVGISLHPGVEGGQVDWWEGGGRGEVVVEEQGARVLGLG